MNQTIVIYEQKRGKSAFLDWLLHLKDVKARAVIRARINRLELGNFGDCKSLGAGVLELRVSFGPGYRVYFGRDGNTVVVLLCGGDKGSQTKDIQKAKLLWKEYKDASKSYRAELLKQLKDPKEAAEYLNACMSDSEEVFLLALRDVVEASGGMANLARKTSLNRENLYRSLSKKGNPKLSSLASILEAVGINLYFAPTKKQKSSLKKGV